MPNKTLEKSNIIGLCNTSTDIPDTEASLDLRLNVINPNIKQMYVTVPCWQYDFAITIFNLTNPPLVNSISWDGLKVNNALMVSFLVVILV